MVDVAPMVSFLVNSTGTRSRRVPSSKVFPAFYQWPTCGLCLCMLAAQGVRGPYSFMRACKAD